MNRMVGRGIVALGAALSVIGGTGAATADSAVHSGSYGRHYLADTREYPGVRCAYDDRNVLDTIRVQAPFVFARDRSSSRDSQTVGWRVQIVGEDGQGDPMVYESPIRTAVGYDDTAAGFTARTFALDYHAGSPYEVRIKMYWYKPGTTTVQGSAFHPLDWYSLPTAPRHGPDGFCSGGIL